MWAFLRLYDTSDATTSCEPSATVIYQHSIVTIDNNAIAFV